MSLALDHSGVMLSRKRITLAEELSSRGITTIPHAIVRTHMRNTVAAHRTGVYKITGPVFYGLSYFLYMLIGFTHVGAAFLGLLATLGVLAVLATLGVPYASVIVLTLGLSSIAFFTWIFVFCELTNVYSPHYNVDLANASSIWMRDRIRNLTRSELRAYGVPEHLHDRVMRVHGIKNVEVHKLRFGIDPILEVSRKGALFTQRVYIGGWDTGVSRIDNA